MADKGGCRLTTPEMVKGQYNDRHSKKTCSFRPSCCKVTVLITAKLCQTRQHFPPKSFIANGKNKTLHGFSTYSCNRYQTAVSDQRRHVLTFCGVCCWLTSARRQTLTLIHQEVTVHFHTFSHMEKPKIMYHFLVFQFDC